MHALLASELLEVWDHASSKVAPERALDLLSIAFPETARSSLERLSIGERDSALLALHEGLFGSRLEAVVACPACGERLDVTFDAAQIRADSESRDEEVSTEADGYSLRLRLVNAGDAIAAAGVAPDAIQQLVVQRCLLAGHRGHDPVDASQLPQEVVEKVAQSLAEADPMADVRMALACPACDRTWSAALDIVSFLWAEIDAWAWRTLSDIHTLATAYGWSEEEILALGTHRRWCYLQMVGA